MVVTVQNWSMQVGPFCTASTKEGQSMQLAGLLALTGYICLRLAVPEIMYLGQIYHMSTIDVYQTRGLQRIWKLYALFAMSLV